MNCHADSVEYTFRIKNSHSSVLVLGFEPWGFFWNLAPGDEYEIVFADAADFWSIESVDCTDEHIIFWAVYPSAVYWLKPEGKSEMMRGTD